MKHAREDYNRIQDPENKIPEEEPVFLLRGQDILAPDTLEFWADEAGNAGADPHIVEAARQQASKMRLWQHDNVSKIPDLPKTKEPVASNQQPETTSQLSTLNSKQKILFLGNFEAEFSSENYYKKTFEKLGHEVITLQEGKATKEDVLSRHDIHLFFWVHTHGWVTEGIVDALAEFKARGIKTFAYHLDLYMGLERWKEYENGIYFKVAHFFTVDKLMADWLNANTETKAHYLPAGVFEGECVLGTPNRDKYPHDIIFTGARGYHSEWPYRPQLIDWLHANYGDRFAHYGNGGREVIRGLELNNLYASAKIVIGDTLCKDFTYPHYFSDRLFEVTGRGGFLIFPKIKGIETFFHANEVLLYNFNDFEGLKKRIDYFLTSDDSREEVRLGGFERTKKEHTYTQRLQQILSTLKEA